MDTIRSLTGPQSSQIPAFETVPISFPPRSLLARQQTAAVPGVGRKKRTAGALARVAVVAAATVLIAIVAAAAAAVAAEVAMKTLEIAKAVAAVATAATMIRLQRGVVKRLSLLLP